MIRERSAKVIQRMVRHFIAKMDVYRGKLSEIRKRLLRQRLRSHLRLYIKKRRVSKGYLRPDIISQASDNMQAVVLIQFGVRKLLQKQKNKCLLSMKRIILEHRQVNDFYLRKYQNLLTRDKETYWI